MELEKNVARFREQGLGVAAISYDTLEILRHFAERVGITKIPMLSDPESEIIRGFRILNHNIPPDNYRYGVPFAGTYVVDPDGVVLSKDFQPDRRERVTMETLLVKHFDVGGGSRVEMRNERVTITTFSSQDVVRRGNRVTLVLDLEMIPNIHVYAPGVDGYIPVSFDLDEHPLVRVIHAPKFPEPRILELPSIKERVPVFDGRVRITRDVTVSLDPEVAEHTEMALTGTLEYQACEDEYCFLPVTVPLTFTLAIAAHDQDRVPESMQITRSAVH